MPYFLSENPYFAVFIELMCSRTPSPCSVQHVLPVIALYRSFDGKFLSRDGKNGDSKYL
jgi:hypothetical protein